MHEDDEDESIGFLGQTNTERGGGGTFFPTSLRAPMPFGGMFAVPLPGVVSPTPGLTVPAPQTPLRMLQIEAQTAPTTAYWRLQAQVKTSPQAPSKIITTEMVFGTAETAWQGALALKGRTGAQWIIVSHQSKKTGQWHSVWIPTGTLEHLKKLETLYGLDGVGDGDLGQRQSRPSGPITRTTTAPSPTPGLRVPTPGFTVPLPTTAPSPTPGLRAPTPSKVTELAPEKPVDNKSNWRVKMYCWQLEHPAVLGLESVDYLRYNAQFNTTGAIIGSIVYPLLVQVNTYCQSDWYQATVWLVRYPQPGEWAGNKSYRVFAGYRHGINELPQTQQAKDSAIWLAHFMATGQNPKGYEFKA